MAKYIDADKLNDRISGLRRSCKQTAFPEVDAFDRGFNNGIFSVAAEMLDMPAADVVEVVRCRDCDMWSDSFEVKDLGKLCMNFRIVTKPDFYCAWGSRTDE